MEEKSKRLIELQQMFSDRIADVQRQYQDQLLEEGFTEEVIQEIFRYMDGALGDSES